MAHIECICPPRADGAPRHPDGDTVTLRPTLGFREALTVIDAVKVVRTDDEATTPDVLAAMTEFYTLLGIESWTLADAKNKPVPVTRANIRALLLTRMEAAMVVADEADELYSGIIVPLVLRTSESSRDTQTEPSTSQPTQTPTSTRPKDGSSPTRQRRSKPSSTTTTRTGGIVQISPSPESDSNSLQSSA